MPRRSPNSFCGTRGSGCQTGAPAPSEAVPDTGALPECLQPPPAPPARTCPYRGLWPQPGHRLRRRPALPGGSGSDSPLLPPPEQEWINLRGQRILRFLFPFKHIFQQIQKETVSFINNKKVLSGRGSEKTAPNILFS